MQGDPLIGNRGHFVEYILPVAALALGDLGLVQGGGFGDQLEEVFLGLG